MVRIPERRGLDETSRRLRELGRRLEVATSARNSDAGTISPGSQLTVKGNISVTDEGSVSVTGQALDWVKSQTSVTAEIANRPRRNNALGHTYLQPGLYMDSGSRPASSGSAFIGSSNGRDIVAKGRVDQSRIQAEGRFSVGQVVASTDSAAITVHTWDSQIDPTGTTAESMKSVSSFSTTAGQVSMSGTDLEAGKFFRVTAAANPMDNGGALLQATWHDDQGREQASITLTDDQVLKLVTAAVEVTGDLRVSTINGRPYPAGGAGVIRHAEYTGSAHVTSSGDIAPIGTILEPDAASPHGNDFVSIPGPSRIRLVPGQYAVVFSASAGASIGSSPLATIVHDGTGARYMSAPAPAGEWQVIAQHPAIYLSAATDLRFELRQNSGETRHLQYRVTVAKFA